MKKDQFKVKVRHKTMLADTVTPVSIYLRLRDAYANALLLESSDYHSHENNFSYLCFDALSSFQLHNGSIQYQLPEEAEQTIAKVPKEEVMGHLTNYLEMFCSDDPYRDYREIGFFGYTSYSAVENFEQIDLKNTATSIPSIRYGLYRFVLAVDHFKNEITIIEHYIDDKEPSRIEEIIRAIYSRNIPLYDFKTIGEEQANMTDERFIEMVTQSKEHCQRGDVFQMVPSRSFKTKFKGDEFNVYRALRSINPSPYLFYFDYGSYKLFGSSPEAHLVIKDGEAEIHPIAGTFKRTGDDIADAEAAKALFDDPKENSEHVMLVDLARNDLSRHCNEVQVDIFKEIQFYSHVIHLVSKVKGQLKQGVSPLQVVSDTFPAGTLTGAPKHRAMQLIDGMEPDTREFYGGAIGFIGLNGNFNHAIIIRSFLSQNNELKYQAGAGVVSKSIEKNELQEVSNKLGALRKALNIAETWI